MKDEYLIPAAVMDMIDRLQQRLMENERMALIQRLEATRDYITKVLEKENRKKWK